MTNEEALEHFDADVETQNAIERFLKTPTRKISKKEAEQNLIACGILNKDGSIAKRYEGIIVKKAEENAKTVDAEPIAEICESAKKYEEDAEPVRHAKWFYPYELFDINRCSLCGFVVQDKISNVPLMFKYCPNCGAKMDGERKEE